MANIGQIKQVIGPVVDVSFAAEGSKLPEILNALEITKTNGETFQAQCTHGITEENNCVFWS